MVDESDNGESASAQVREATPQDGLISVSGYSDHQLRELRDTIDRQRFPLNFDNLIREIAQREDRARDPASWTTPLEGRFSRLDGVRGWLEAKQTLSPVYGEGSVEVTSTELIISGWHRTWLGVPALVQLAFGLNQIRNVYVESGTVSFEIKAPYRMAKRLTFYSDVAQVPALLAEKLPSTATRSFEKNYKENRDFIKQLRLVAPRPLVTPALVAMNVLVFLWFCIANHRVGGFAGEAFIAAGANFGPLTVNGQWWRLISAEFLHATVPHLVLNMWAFWNIGRLTERLFGRPAFAFLYLSCAVLASLSSVAWDPNLMTVGASGAIFGILGASIAFNVRPESRVPVPIARRHWISTSVFVLFNLISGAMQVAIDNGAHIGGLVAGFVLGWILARPLGTPVRSVPYRHQPWLAVGVCMAAVAAGVWQVKGSGSQLSFPEQYARAHSAFIAHETENLREWNDLAVKATSGAISDRELGERFERDILPFWKVAVAQNEIEVKSLRGTERAYVALVLDFSRLRYEWATKLVEAVKTQDQGAVAEAAAYVEKLTKAQARLDRVKMRAQMDHRPRALSNSAAVSSIRRLFFKLTSQCIDSPFTIKKTDNPLDGPAARYAAGCRAQQLFMAEDYETLDALLDGYIGSIPDLPDGSSRYQGAIDGLETLAQFGRINPLQLLERTSNWRRAVKNSSKPDLLEALIFREWAWSIRGAGSADSVTAQNRLQFVYRVEMAAASLEQSARVASADPTWYEYSMAVGLDREEKIDKLRDMFDVASRRFPAYWPIERQILRALLPRWGGSYDQIDQFINDMYVSTAKERGYERYAELYTEYAALEGDDLQLFTDTPASWSAVAQGYVGLLKRYPMSDVVLNRFASMACRAGDADQYRGMRDQLTSRYSSVVWSSTLSLKYCDLKFARSPAKPPAPTAAEFSPRLPVLALGGAHLGMSARDLLEAKGEPTKKTADRWTYESVVAQHNGALTVGFGKNGDGDAQVVDVAFIGDADASPKELPYLEGLTESELRDKFTYLVGMGSPSEDTTRLKYRNGVYADLRNDRVISYGIYAIVRRR